MVSALRPTLASATLRVTRVKMNVGLEPMLSVTILIRNTFSERSSRIINRIIRWNQDREKISVYKVISKAIK